jgi:eukaryotic-like serine/threonine-protein kinase
MPLSASFRLGPYEIVSRLGAGGMGEVYRAKDTRLGRFVAIKILPQQFVSKPEALKRFQREAKALAALSHPNIVTIHDVGTEGGIPFVVMELLEGETLRHSIRDSGLTQQRALDVAIAVGEGLAAAHSKGVIHRDLKPENIFLTSNGSIKILDFGLASWKQDSIDSASMPTESAFATDTGLIMGTIPYMSPEQLSGKPIDARSDIFSFGCILYEMLSGDRPFGGNTPAETIAAILKENPRQLSSQGKEIPSRLEQIIGRCLQKDPDQRFQTASDLIFSLRDLTSTEIKERPSAAGKSRSFHPIALFTIVLLLCGAIGTFLYVNRRAKPLDSIAVLPFVNASENPDTEYLSDGITESLINNLSQLSNLRVIARATVFRYKGRETDPQKVGRDLSVRAVLTGKLLQRGDTIVVQADLMDVGNGAQLWGEQYNRKPSDIFAMQEEISKEIANKLRLKLTGQQQTLLARRYTENPKAYQLYLKGRYFWNQRTPESLRKSIQYYQQATDKDPNYALAYAGLADSYAVLAINSDASPKESYPLAKKAAEKALELDDTLVEAHATIINIKTNYDWDWAAAEKEYKRAIELNPNYPITYLYYSAHLSKLGRHTESIAAMKRAQEMDPLSLIINTLVARSYYYARQYDEVIQQCRRTLEIEPNFAGTHLFLGRAYIQKGLYDQAISELSRAIELSGVIGDSTSLIGYAYATSDRKAEAQKVIDQLIERSKQHYVSPYFIAVVYAGLGEKDRAFEWLEKAYQDRSQLVTFINVAPQFDALRSDARFQDLLRRMNLP